MDVTHVTEPPPNALPMSLRRLGQLARGVGLLRGTLRSLSDLDESTGDDPAVLEVARNVLRLAADLVAAALGAECAAELFTLRLDAAVLAAGPTSGALRLGASALLGYLSGVVPVVDGGAAARAPEALDEDVAHLPPPVGTTGRAGAEAVRPEGPIRVVRAGSGGYL